MLVCRWSQSITAGSVLQACHRVVRCFRCMSDAELHNHAGHCYHASIKRKIMFLVRMAKPFSCWHRDTGGLATTKETPHCRLRRFDGVLVRMKIAWILFIWPSLEIGRKSDQGCTSTRNTPCGLARIPSTLPGLWPSLRDALFVLNAAPMSAAQPLPWDTVLAIRLDFNVLF